MPHLKEQWVQEGDTLIGCSLFCWSHCSPTLTDRQRGFTIWGHNQSLGTTAPSGGRVRQCGLCTTTELSKPPAHYVSNVGHGNAPTLPLLYVKIHVRQTKDPPECYCGWGRGWRRSSHGCQGFWGPQTGQGCRPGGRNKGQTDSSHVQDLKLLNIRSLMLGSRVEQKRHEHSTLQPIITLIWQR